MPTRRELLSHSATVAALLASAALLPTRAQASWNAAAFSAKTLSEVPAALGIAAPVESADVRLSSPDIAENGSQVPIGVATSLAGVQRMLILIEKNPAVLAAAFDVTEAVEARFNTRVKMAQSSNVYAVAVMRDGRVLFAQKEVNVTLGGCGE